MWRTFIAILFLVGWASSACCQSKGSANQHNGGAPNGHHEAAANQRGTDLNPLSVKLLNTGQSEQEAANEAAHVRYEESTEAWTIKLTIVAIGIGLFQLLAFIIQAYYMRGTVSEMRRSNAAAEAANQATERAMLAADRPWVGIDSIGIMPLKAGEGPDVLITVRNSGKTPAHHLRSNVVGQILLSTFGAPSLPPEPPPIQGAGTLMPNGIFHYRPFLGAAPLTEEQINAIKSGENLMWIVGTIHYANSANHQHTTTFRAVYEPQKGAFAPSIAGNTVS